MKRRIPSDFLDLLPFSSKAQIKIKKNIMICQVKINSGQNPGMNISCAGIEKQIFVQYVV